MSWINAEKIAEWARNAGLRQLDGMTFHVHATTPEILECFAVIAYSNGLADGWEQERKRMEKPIPSFSVALDALEHAIKARSGK